MFIHCQLNGSKKSALQSDHYSIAGKTYGNRKLESERARKKLKINKIQKVRKLKAKS